MRKKFLALTLFLGCANTNAVTITSSEYGEAWPFTVSAGDLKCVNNKAIVFTAGETEYAVNGTAVAMKFKRIDEIWLQDMDGLRKVDIHPIIERGLSLCLTDKKQSQ